MGVQRQEPPPPHSTGGQPAPRMESRSGHLWNKLPRILNLARYQSKAANEQHNEVVDYEPIHLHVSPSEVHPVAAMMGRDNASDTPRQLNVETFKFVMDQVPAVRTIEFSGRVDPFRNDELLQFVDYAFRFNGAESTIITDGFMLDRFIEPILTSTLHTLVIRIQAHRPSAYAQVTGRKPNEFVTLRDNVAALVKRKKELGSKLEIDLVMIVDRHNYPEMADMVRFAEALGVDGLRFENYIAPNTPGVKSDRSIYTHQKGIIKALMAFKEEVAKPSRLLITLPTLLDADMSEHRHCLDPYTTVSVDSEFNVTGCSRQLVSRGKMGKVWEENFWNNDMYQWLRSIHGKQGQNLPDRPSVPLPCQNCPRNMPHPRR